jgi:hypothetical protein
MAKGSFVTKIPLTIPRCVAWIDAADTSTITSSGGLVGKIINKVGSGNNVQQLTASAQPKNNTRTLNGLPVLEFAHDGTRNDFMVFDNNDPLDAPFTVFCLGQSDQNYAGSDQAFMGRQTGAVPGQWTLLRNGNFAIFQTYLFGIGGDSGATQTSNNNANIYTVHFLDGDRLKFKLNNNTATQGSIRSGYNNAVATPLAIGASNNTLGAPLDGIIAEVIIYNRVLTDSEIINVNCYLANKWGIAIS